MGALSRLVTKGVTTGGKLTKKEPKITIPKNILNMTDTELEKAIKDIRSKSPSTESMLKARLAMEKLKKAKKIKDKEGKKKIPKEASTQKGMIGSGAKSAPGKGAKNPKAKDEEPMRKASDARIAEEAVTGKITAATDLPMWKVLQTPAQKARVKEYIRLMIKKQKAKDENGPPLTPKEKQWLKSDAGYEAQRLRRVGQGTDNTRKAASEVETGSSKGRTPGASKKTPQSRKKALELEKNLKKPRVDDMGDPRTGEVTTKTTRERVRALDESAKARDRVAKEAKESKKSRRNWQALLRRNRKNKGGAIAKPKMAYGGTVNKKKHMYTAGGSVKDYRPMQKMKK